MREQKPNKADRFFLRLAQMLPFRKQGGSYLSIAVIMFVAVLVVYLLSAVFRGLDEPVSTVTAVEYETSAGYYSSGYIVRTETVLTSDASITSLVLSEGQKAAVGEPVAMGYTSTSAQQRQQQISHLEESLSQLQYAAGTSATVHDRAALDAQIRDELMRTAVLLGKGRISAVRESSAEIKGLILRRSVDEDVLSAIADQITEIENEISRLRKELSGSVKSIKAPRAGYFSGTTDGYESVLTPESILSLSVSEFSRLQPAAKQAGAVGKILSGDTWYYLTVLPADTLKNLKIGSTVTVGFAQDASANIPMTLSHISQEEDGKVVAALRADRYLQDMTLMRQQNADIIFKTHTGLRVPKQAVRVTEDGSVGVFVLDGATANWKRVSILHDNGETYLVELDKSSTENLWPGDEIILSGVEELHDGKVVF